MKFPPFPFVDILLLLRIQSLCTANEHINTNKLENAYTHKHTPSKKNRDYKLVPADLPNK